MAGLALTGLMKLFDSDNKYSDKLVTPLAKTMVPKDGKDRSGRTRKSSRDHVDHYPRSREERRRSTGGRDFERTPPSRDHDGGRRRHRSRSYDRHHRYDHPRRAATFDDSYYDSRPKRGYRDRLREETDSRSHYHHNDPRQHDPRHYHPPPPPSVGPPREGRPRDVPPRDGPPREGHRRAGPPPDDRRSSTMYNPR